MPKFSLAPVVGALCFALPSQFVLADDESGAEASLDTLVVSATRIATPAAQLGSSVTVITAADIAAKQLRTVPEVLRLVPGLNVVQSGGPGGVTSVFMRGTNSNQTKVLIDGIDVSDPSNAGATFDFGQLLAADIERIEVLRGPQSGLYGSDAIGGVISITTRSVTGRSIWPAASKGVPSTLTTRTFPSAAPRTSFNTPRMSNICIPAARR